MKHDWKRLATRTGFIATFWEILAERERTGAKGPTQLAIYEELEAEITAVIGGPVFPSFDAFRQYRNRKIRAAQRCSNTHKNDSVFHV